MSQSQDEEHGKHTHNKDCYRGPQQETKENVGPVVFVVIDAGQSGVEGQHETNKLQEWTEESWGLELESHLEVDLEIRHNLKLSSEPYNVNF